MLSIRENLPDDPVRTERGCYNMSESINFAKGRRIRSRGEPNIAQEATEMENGIDASLTCGLDVGEPTIIHKTDKQQATRRSELCLEERSEKSKGERSRTNERGHPEPPRVIRRWVGGICQKQAR